MAGAVGLMAGKRGLIMGLANNRSMAWGIAKSLHSAGAEIALTYQGDAQLVVFGYPKKQKDPGSESRAS